MAEQLTVARPYAKALYESMPVNDAKALLPVMEFCKALGETEEAKVFLKSPSLTAEKLLVVLKSTAGKTGLTSVPEKFEDFAKVLEHNKRFALLPDVAMLFIDEVNKSNDTVIAEIFTAKLLSDSSRNNLIEKLEQKYGKKIEATIEVDQSLIGGALVKIGDTVIDGSIKGRLEQLTKALN